MTVPSCLAHQTRCTHHNITQWQQQRMQFITYTTFLINVGLYLCRFCICYVTMHSLCSVQEENVCRVRNAYRSKCFNSRTAAWFL